MKKFRKEPSRWLKYNSAGYPDFLFTILTCSLMLLGIVCLIWVIFGILAIFHAESNGAEIYVKVMDNMKTGLIALAGVVFGLAGSYTVRRFKKDQTHELRKTRKAKEQTGKTFQLVEDEEDI